MAQNVERNGSMAHLRGAKKTMQYAKKRAYYAIVPPVKKGMRKARQKLAPDGLKDRIVRDMEERRKALSGKKTSVSDYKTCGSFLISKKLL